MEEQSDHVWSKHSTYPFPHCATHAPSTRACAGVTFSMHTHKHESRSFSVVWYHLVLHPPAPHGAEQGTGKRGYRRKLSKLTPFTYHISAQVLFHPSGGENQEEIPHMFGHRRTTVRTQKNSEEPCKVRRAQTPKQRQGPSGSVKPHPAPHAITSEHGIRRDWSFCLPWMFR